MTERDFLDAQSRRIRRRIRRGSDRLQARLEHALGPTIREHPRAAMAVGASAGLLLGGLLGPALRAPAAARRRTLLGGALGFVGATGLQALRATLTESILRAAAKPTEAAGRTNEAPDADR